MHLLLIQDMSDRRNLRVAIVCKSHTFNERTGSFTVTGATYCAGAGALLSEEGREASDERAAAIRRDIEAGHVDLAFSSDWALLVADTSDDEE